MTCFKAITALTIAAGLTFAGAASAQAATPTVARKVVVTDSKIKVGTLEKERAITDSKIKSGTFEKERSITDEKLR